MRRNTIHLTAIGALSLSLAFLLWLRACDHGGSWGDRSAIKNSEISPPEAAKQEMPRLQSNRQANKRPDNTKRSRVEWNWNDFKPLDWTVDQLDDFLQSKSTELTSSEMASLMNSIFPEPTGAPDSSNRLKSGSIPLKEQMRLCMKYVEPEDQPMVFAGFWATYRKSNALEDYRRDVLEQIPCGYSRTRAVTDFYANRFRDFPDVRIFLSSDELTDLKPMEPETRIDSTLSDYTGVVYAVAGTLRQHLEQGKASAEEIIDTLKTSKLDEENKIRLIRSIEKRGKEIELMRKQ